MKDQDLPFALLRWIKAQQRDLELHQAYMRRQRAKEDETFLNVLEDTLKNWNKMSQREKIAINRIFATKQSLKNLTYGERSFIVTLYLKQTKAS